MKIRTAFLVFALLAPLAAFAADNPDDSGPAEAIARSAMAAMGGEEAWNATRLVRFDWAVERDGEQLALYHHTWDRWSGDYLLTGKTREGQALEVRFNVDSREGEARLDGELLAGEDAAARLEQAYGRFINDSYWILMPWKWLDPGVDLRSLGERQHDGRTYDVVELSFDSGTGLTSNDRYLAWVDRESGRMERWQYVLQDEAGEPGEGEPTTWEWGEWIETESGMAVSTVKRRVGGEGDVRITFPKVDFRAVVTDEELAAAFAAD